jgi:hypothetical protein
MPYSPPLEDACIPQAADIAGAVRALVLDGCGQPRR